MHPSLTLLGPPGPLGWEGTFRLGRACSPRLQPGPWAMWASPRLHPAMGRLSIPPFSSFFSDLPFHPLPGLAPPPVAGREGQGLGGHRPGDTGEGEGRTGRAGTWSQREATQCSKAEGGPSWGGPRARSGRESDWHVGLLGAEWDWESSVRVVQSMLCG